MPATVVSEAAAHKGSSLKFLSTKLYSIGANDAVDRPRWPVD